MSDVTDPKTLFMTQVAQMKKPKTWVGSRPLACLIANRALVLHGGIGQVGIGCGKIGNQPVGCQTFASIKKLSEYFEAKSICHFLTPDFLSEYIDDVLEVMGCGASATFGTWPGVVLADKNGCHGCTNSLAVTGPCPRRRYSQRRC